jgi:hypothetical protein
MSAAEEAEARGPALHPTVQQKEKLRRVTSNVVCVVTSLSGECLLYNVNPVEVS